MESHSSAPGSKDGIMLTLPLATKQVVEPLLEQSTPKSAPGSPSDDIKAQGGVCSHGPCCCLEATSVAQLSMVSPLLVQSCALGVLFYEGITYNLIFLRKILPAVGKDAFVLPLGITFNIVYGLALWSYFRAHCSDPGQIPEKWLDFVQRVGTEMMIVPARLEWQPGKATFCKKCCIARPERAHHCNICGVCALRMDHHCPWINNCVGFMNHKFFLLLVIYAFGACLTALVTTMPELLYFSLSVLRLQHSDVWEMPELSMSEVLTFLVFGALALGFLALLSPMLAQHLHLATLNATTIESHYDNMSNPFDLGSTDQNLRQIFGVFGLDWFVPVLPRRPLTDGVSFMRNFEKLAPDGLPLGMVRDSQLPWTTQENLWRIRYQVRSVLPPEVPDHQLSIEHLLGITKC